MGGAQSDLWWARLGLPAVWRSGELRDVQENRTTQPVAFSAQDGRTSQPCFACGDGATIVVSGGLEPSEIFYNDFWTAPTLLENVRITGLVLDGNLQNQVMTVYAPSPTNLNGTGVWQHGCAVTVAAGRKIEVDHCVFRNFRGDALRFFKNDNLDPSEFISFHHNELDGIFTQGVGGIGIGVWIYNNWFHGDGYWVAGIDFETLDHRDELRDAWVYSNVFDFRDGLSPVERTPAICLGFC
jgi:hypothetical protein